MSSGFPAVPVGSGKHPVQLVTLSANDLAGSIAFYARVFGWKSQNLTPDLAAVPMPSGPSVALRAGVPEGFPGAVPYIGVPDVNAALARVAGSGGSVEKATWSLPLVGNMARFKDPAGTIYGLMSATPAPPPIPAPFGTNPKPQPGTLCSLEMYAASGADAASFFAGQFGWGSVETMPQYMAFDPGAGIGGVWQSHTPVAPAMAYVYVADVSACLADIERSGGKRLGDPATMPGMGTFGYFTDPSGTAMGLIGP